MLLDSKLPKYLWGYAILHANYMKNRRHTHALPNQTPYEMVHQKKPDLHTTHEWGSVIYVKIDEKDKLSARAKTAKWIGFSSQSDRHCIYWPKSHKISIKRNILFDKEKLHKYMPILPTEEDIQKTIQTAERNHVIDPFIKSGYAPGDISEQREVEDMIEITLQRELEPLQTSCKRITPVETEPSRRSKQIYAKTHPPSIPGPVTRSMAKKGICEDVFSFVYPEENNTQDFLKKV